MVIEVTSEGAYIHNYVKLLQGRYKLTNRETYIAGVIVRRIFVLESARSKLSESKRDTYDSIREFKNPKVLKHIMEEIGIDMVVLRRYLTILRDKGMFVGGKLNPEFLPSERETTITVRWKY